MWAAGRGVVFSGLTGAPQLRPMFTTQYNVRDGRVGIR